MVASTWFQAETWSDPNGHVKARRGATGGHRGAPLCRGTLAPPSGNFGIFRRGWPLAIWQCFIAYKSWKWRIWKSYVKKLMQVNSQGIGLSSVVGAIRVFRIVVIRRVATRSDFSGTSRFAAHVTCPASRHASLVETSMSRFSGVRSWFAWMTLV